MANFDESSGARKRLLHVAIHLLVIGVLADQASKTWASHRAAEPRILVPGYVIAYSVPNAGGLLGFCGDQAQTNMVVALCSIACAVLLVRFAYADRWRWRGAELMASALVLAGILGNTLDRFALGHVRDFLVTRALPYLAFNVADLLLVVGAASLLMARLCDSRHYRSRLGLAG